MWSVSDHYLLLAGAREVQGAVRATLGFSDKAHLDDGTMWPIVYALTELTPADEERIAKPRPVGAQVSAARRRRSSSRRRRLLGRPSPRTARIPGRTSVTTGGGLWST